MDRPFIAAVQTPGPFQVLARPYRIKPEKRSAPVAGEAIAVRAVQAGSDPQAMAAHLIDGSGLRDRDADGLSEHSSDPQEMWLSAKGQGGTWLEFDFGTPRPLGTICLWNFNDAWHTGRGIRQADVSVWTRETGWRKVWENLSLDQAPGDSDYDEPTVVTLHEPAVEKVRLDDLVSCGDVEYGGLSEVQFFAPFGPQAGRPYPTQDMKDVEPNGLTLTWTPGTGAVVHQVYLGTDAANLPLLGKTESPAIRCPGLAEQTKYLWRVDEVRPDGATTVGKTWSFATGGLVVWWKLDESEGDRAADASGHGHDGTLRGGAVWQPGAGRLGGALEFDGRDDKVENTSVCESLNGLAALTVSAWVKSDVTNQDRDILFTRDPTGSDHRIGLRYDRSGTFAGGRQGIKASIGTTWGEVQIESSSGVQKTDWQHLAFAWRSGASVRLYIDGVPDPLTYDSGPVPGTVMGVEKLLVGLGTKNAYWDGLIDDVRIYGYALSPEQIAALHAGGQPGNPAAAQLMRAPGQAATAMAQAPPEPAQRRTGRNWIIVLAVLLGAGGAASWAALRKNTGG